MFLRKFSLSLPLSLPLRVSPVACLSYQWIRPVYLSEIETDRADDLPLIRTPLSLLFARLTRTPRSLSTSSRPPPHGPHTKRSKPGRRSLHSGHTGECCSLQYFFTDLSFHVRLKQSVQLAHVCCCLSPRLTSPQCWLLCRLTAAFFRSRM